MVNIATLTYPEPLETVEAKAEKCRTWPVTPGVWAIRKSGAYYCFIADEKPSCAGECSELLEMRYQTALTGGKLEVVSERHYECPVRKKD